MLTTVVSAIEIGDDFYLYGQDDKKLATALGMTEDEVKTIFTYFAQLDRFEQKLNAL